MWSHPAVQENVAKLVERGHELIGPDEGAMAEEAWGVGRLAEPERIVDRALEILGSRRTLSGRRFLVTAGPTREALDTVRFLSNPSSGKMGYAIASAAVRRGAEVVLVSGPTSLPDPEGVRVIRVTTAAQMREAVLGSLDRDMIVVKAAAVSDFAAASPVDRKVKKEGAPLTLELVPTPDILKEIASVKEGRFIVGFAAETDDVVANARKKLMEKGLDLIVANDVGGGAVFGSEDGAVIIVDRQGREERFGPASKQEIAERLLDVIEDRSAA